MATILYAERQYEGAEHLRCEAIWTNGFCVLSISYRYDHDPVFRPRSRKELDRSGNRRMSRPSWIGAVFGCQRNESRQELVWYVIRPDAGVESTNSSTAVEKYKIGDRNSMFLFDRFCNTTGRGYARYLNQITSRSHRLGSGDSSSVEALGYYSTWFDGRWRLNCQQASGHLAREVSFTPKGWDKPLLSVTNSGSIECPGLTIAASGAETYSGTLRTDIQVLSLTNFSSSDVVNSECARMLAPMDEPVPPGKMHILDRRGPVTKMSRQ